MKCKNCPETDESKIMERTSVEAGKVQTIRICLECWWKEIHGNLKIGNGNG